MQKWEMYTTNKGTWKNELNIWSLAMNIDDEPTRDDTRNIWQKIFSEYT